MERAGINSEQKLRKVPSCCQPNDNVILAGLKTRHIFFFSCEKYDTLRIRVYWDLQDINFILNVHDRLTYTYFLMLPTKKYFFLLMKSRPGNMHKTICSVIRMETGIIYMIKPSKYHLSLGVVQVIFPYHTCAWVQIAPKGFFFFGFGTILSVPVNNDLKLQTPLFGLIDCRIDGVDITWSGLTPSVVHF